MMGTMPRRVIVLLFAIVSADVASADCYRLQADVELLLRDLSHAAHASGTVTCYASNNTENYLDSFTGTETIHQINPAVDFNQQFAGSGQLIVSLDAPADYSVKTCYQAFIDASSGFTAGHGQSGELCTPDPPGPLCVSCGCDGTLCQQSATCPVILDLNDDGIRTTSLADGVRFWTDYDGDRITTAWTDPAGEEAFLWIDLNDDHVAQVDELFGSRMKQPDGGLYPNGFQALSAYDSPAFGGDGDGKITQHDRVWARLRLWVDRNHDGKSQPAEVSVLSSHGITALDLDRRRGYMSDGNDNVLYLVGSYVTGARGGESERHLMGDIEFQSAPYGPE